MMEIRRLDDPYDVTCPYCGLKQKRYTDVRYKRCNCGKRFEPKDVIEINKIKGMR